MEEGKKEEYKVIDGNRHEEHKKPSAKKNKLEHLYFALIIVLAVVLLVNVVLTFNLNKDFKKNTAKAEEKLKPAKIELAIIKNSKCSECLNVSPVVTYLRNLKLNITKESNFDLNSKEAKELISKYKIDKVPIVIITGEIDKVSNEGFTKIDDALLLSTVAPPYTNTTNGKVEGRVTLYVLKDSSCVKCDDLSILLAQLKSAGIKIYSEKNLSTNSPTGQGLIKKYKIDFAPSLILSEDAHVYPIIQEAWLQIGTKESDGSYVLRLVYPPYVNLTTNELKGLVKITYLTDKSCTECYDVNIHKQILTSQQSFGIKLDQEETYDISDVKGKELINRYNVTLVPAVMLSKDISAYPTSQALKQFFTVEKDGSFVFRTAQIVGSYKDLTTNKVVKPQQQNPQSETQTA